MVHASLRDALRVCALHDVPRVCALHGDAPHAYAHAPHGAPHAYAHASDHLIHHQLFLF